MEKRDERDGLGELEAVAVGLIRRARRSGERLGEAGYRFVGIADWLEGRVTQASAACRDAVRAALFELAAPPSPKDDEN